jgi:hypothetical protein
MLELHQWWGKTFYGKENFFAQKVITDYQESFLENIVAKLVIDELLDNKVYSGLQVLRLLSSESKLLNKLLIIARKGTLEDLVNMCFSLIWLLGIKALFDDITGKLELTQSDEVFGDLSEDSLVSMGILKLENVLNQVVTIWIFNEVWHVFNDVVCKLQLLSLSTFF